MLAYPLLVAALVGFQVQDSTQAGGQEEGETRAGFAPYENDEAGFRVDMFGTPEVETEVMASPAGEIPVLSVTSTDGVGAYTVTSTEYPDALAGREPDVVFNNVRDGAVSRGRLIRERPVTLDGYPGREIEYEWPGDGVSQGTLYARDRIYLVGNRLYRTIYMSETPETSTPQVDRWLDSFQLVFRDGRNPPVRSTRVAPRADRIARMVSAAIPFLGGVYGTLLGYRRVGKKPGEDFNYDLWHQRRGKMLRILGPVLIVFGLLSGLGLFSPV